MYPVILVILAILASFSNAVEDTIAHHFYNSVFMRIRNFKIREWFESNWQNRPSHPVWFLWDAWHFFKTLRILCCVLGILVGGNYKDAIIFVAIWAMVFNLFYKKILLIEEIIW